MANQDPRPWLVFYSPRRGFRVKKRDVLAMKQGRKDERFVGNVPPDLPSDQALKYARAVFRDQVRTGSTPPNAAITDSGDSHRPWHGYHGPKGCRLSRGPSPLLDGEKEIGVFAADLLAEDAWGLALSRCPKPTPPAKRGYRR